MIAPLARLSKHHPPNCFEDDWVYFARRNCAGLRRGPDHPSRAIRDRNGHGIGSGAHDDRFRELRCKEIRHRDMECGTDRRSAGGTAGETPYPPKDCKEVAVCDKARQPTSVKLQGSTRLLRTAKRTRSLKLSNPILRMMWWR